jgi:uncharacterized protein YeaO (DUF488 family)
LKIEGYIQRLDGTRINRVYEPREVSDGTRVLVVFI